MRASMYPRAALVLLLAAMLIGCGGSELLPSGRSSSGDSIVTATTQQQVRPFSFEGVELTTAQARRPADPFGMKRPGLRATALQPGLNRGASSAYDAWGLPPLPSDVIKRTSVAYTDTADPGAPVDEAANAQSGPGKTSLFSSPGTASWAYFGLPTWATKASQTATIDGTMLVKVNGFKSGIYIALANYTTGKWEFFPNVYNLTAPAVVNFKPSTDYISAFGNVYILVAAWNGDHAEITGVSTSGDDSNVPPIAALTVTDNVGYTGMLAQLDATSSSDSDLSIVKYGYDLGDGNGFVDQGPQASIVRQFDTPGAYMIQVRVTDEGGLTAVAQQPIIVVDTASFLPLSWYRARMNGGLAFATMGAADIFGPGFAYPNFYFNNFLDLETKLPPYWSAWYADPEGFPAAVDAQATRINTAASIQDILLEANAQYWTDHQIAKQTFNPTLDAAQPLSSALADFVTTAGGTPDQAMYQTAVAAMPLPQQRALARVVLAASSALARRAAAFAAVGLTDPATVQLLFDGAHGDPTGGLITVNTGQFIGALWDVTGGNYLLAGFPYDDAFFTGSAELADAIDQLRDFDTTTSPTWGPAMLNLTVDTPAGQIRLRGTGPNTHQVASPDGHAILIDLGGNDTYNCQAGANADGPNGVAVCIDLGAGDDVYNRIDDPDDVDRTVNPSDDNTSQQGAGRMGVGMLVDFGGNDQYQSVRLSQGCGILGVGVLADLGGDDTYDMEALGQGAAFAGIGLLLDEDGSDNYTGWHKVQGFGSIMGIGLLADRGAAVDTYTAVVAADPAKPEYDGGSGVNLSFAQGAAIGAAFGWLTFGGQNEVGGGGYGLVLDGGGDDAYTCAAFGQGCGYYQSTGLLIDMDGVDTRTSASSAQAAGMTTGVGVLYDVAGADLYDNGGGMGIGGANDWGLSWLLDRGSGGDQYRTGVLGLGAGNNNALGYFLEWGGNDQYAAQPSASGFENTSLGKGNLGANGDETLPSYGIFVDDSGNDTYALEYANMANAQLGLPGNGQWWVRLVEGTFTNGHGSGVDN